MADVPCPLAPHVKLQLGNRMNLSRVMDIEIHKSRGVCVHPELNDIIMHGSLEGSTPLLLACGEGHLDSVKRMTQRWGCWGADVNAAGIYYHSHHRVKVAILGATPLIVASLKGRIDIVQFLISKGADLSARTSAKEDRRYDGLDPLHAALIDELPGQSFSEKCAESSEIVRRLLAGGADPSTLDAYGNPVWTYRFCSIGAIKALVEQDLNLNQPNSKGETILHHWIDSVRDIDINEEERLKVIQILANRNTNNRRNLSLSLVLKLLAPSTAAH